MSSRREWQERPDELDRLVAQALHAAVRYAEPSPRVWQNVRAALAEPIPPRPRRTLARAIVNWCVGVLAPSTAERAMPFMVHGVRFADVGPVAPSLVWWLDPYTADRSVRWQACRTS